MASRLGIAGRISGELGPRNLDHRFVINHRDPDSGRSRRLPNPNRWAFRAGIVPSPPANGVVQSRHFFRGRITRRVWGDRGVQLTGLGPALANIGTSDVEHFLIGRCSAHNTKSLHEFEQPREGLWSSDHGTCCSVLCRILVSTTRSWVVNQL